MIETATITNRSGPSSTNISHNRKWVWNEMKFAKGVVYYLAAYDDVESM